MNMAHSATPADPFAHLDATQSALAQRIGKIRFYDIAALCREVVGGPIGFDVNRKFEGTGSKNRFAVWAVENLDNAALLSALPPYEDRSTKYYAKRKPRSAAAVLNSTAGSDRKSALPVGRSAKGAALLAALDEPPAATPTAPAGLPRLSLALDMSALERSVRDMCTHAVHDALKQADAMDAVRQDAVVAWAEGAIDDALLHALQGTPSANTAGAAEPAHMDTVREYVDTAVAHALASVQKLHVTVTREGRTQGAIINRQHKTFPALLRLCAVRKASGCALNIWLSGPAGSGKTSAARAAATALGLPFHFTGAVDNEYKLLGFVDAQGRTVRTAFREAYEHGGVFLLDEVDGCHASAMLALNGALANDECDFPDGSVKRHPDCVVIAAANTWGHGATFRYIGRNKLDAASLDRFVTLAWNYDEALERDTCGNPEWAKKVQEYRRKADTRGMEVVISPRASYDGALLLAAGMDQETVIAATLRKGMTETQWRDLIK